MNTISLLSESFKGEELWVLGNGPSLHSVPQDLMPVSKSIGCNRILKTHRTRFVAVVDDNVWEQEQNRFRMRDVDLLVHDVLYNKLIRGHYPEHRIWTFPFEERVPPMGSTTVLHRGYLTGYYAAEIACQMVRPGGSVILAGMDLRYTEEMKERCETHASGDERPNGASDNRFKEGRAALRRLRIAASTFDVEMFVAGPSALIDEDGFPSYQCLP